MDCLQGKTSLLFIVYQQGEGNVCRGKFIVYGIPIHKFEGERVGQRESRKEIAIDREENIFFFK